MSCGHDDFHQDPTVGFEEGKFYLLVQKNQNDFVSEGPWVDGVGVDKDNDDVVDLWTDFEKISESCVQIEGFCESCGGRSACWIFQV